jgi:hypothetical protein
MKVGLFQVVYGFNPHAPIDLLPLPPSEKYQIAGSKGQKKVKLEPGDLVWLHLRKEQFTNLRKSKHMFHANGPFKILEKINDSAYKLELPLEFRVSPTFNISDL